MPSFCGPKCSVCCTVLSAWGVVMLGLLGVFFYIKTPILAEDLTIDELEWKRANFSREFIGEIYEQNAYNCWVAAALYGVTLIISVIMIKVNMKQGRL